MPLASLRLGLVLANSVVLLASVVTLFAWLELREELVLGAGRLVAESAGVMVTAVQTYLDQLLFLTALNLFLYWALHGVVLAARSGILEGELGPVAGSGPTSSSGWRSSRCPTPSLSSSGR